MYKGVSRKKRENRLFPRRFTPLHEMQSGASLPEYPTSHVLCDSDVHVLQSLRHPCLGLDALGAPVVASAYGGLPLTR